MPAAIRIASITGTIESYLFSKDLAYQNFIMPWYFSMVIREVFTAGDGAAKLVWDACNLG
jgi:hypothetical protein